MIESIDLFHKPYLCYQINRAEHVCATVIIKHNYMLMCNHKIVINIMLCTGKSRSIVDLPTYDDTRNRSIGTCIIRDDKSIIIISYPYGNSLSMSPGFQITNFDRTNKHVTECF